MASAVTRFPEQSALLGSKSAPESHFALSRTGSILLQSEVRVKNLGNLAQDRETLWSALQQTLSGL